MILIVSDHIGLTIAKYRKQVTGLSRCRLVGMMDGVKVRIVPRHLVGHMRVDDQTKMIWDGFEPTVKEKALAKCDK